VNFPTPFRPQVGVHVNLPFEAYISVEAIGSSDLKRLYKEPWNWWFGSRYNPNRKDAGRPQRHFVLGSALHTLLLEGRAVYDARYITPPRKDDPALATTPRQVQKLLLEHGVAEAKGELNSARLASMARKAGLADRCYDTRLSAFNARKKIGGEALTHAEERGILHMAEMVMAEPEIAPHLKMGLPEVSVFWIEQVPLADGSIARVLMRARFDLLLPTVTLDLKTLNPWGSKSLAEAVGSQIRDFRYDMQARLYHTARQKAREFIAAGQVYSWLPDGAQGSLVGHEKDVLTVVEHQETWFWGWLFYQMMDDTGAKPRAPILDPYWYGPQDPNWTEAGEHVEIAIANFAELRAEFGLEQPWQSVRPFSRLGQDQLWLVSREQADRYIPEKKDTET